MTAAEATLKSLTLIFLTSLAVTIAAGAEASLETSSDQIVWANNPGVDEQLYYSCESSDLVNITVEKNGDVIEGLEGSEGAISSSQIDSAVSLEDNLGDIDFALYCKNSTEPETAKSSALLEVKKLLVSYGDDAKGFFGTGEKLEDSEFQNPITIKELKVDHGDIPPKEVQSDVSFSFPGDDIGVENGDWDLVTDKIYPIIGSNFNPSQDKVDLKVTYSGLSETVELTKKVDIEVYPYRPELLGGSLGRKMSYENIEDFSYSLNLVPGKDVSDTVYQEDFRLTITQISGEGGVVREDAKLFVASQPEGETDYRLTWRNYPDLTLGEKYEFKTYIKKNGRTTPVDSIRVVNNLQFSGVVTDSTGSPVETEMVLKRSSSENLPIKTGSDGTYSTQIETRDFDSVTLKFFDRGLSSPDSKFQLKDITLGENPNLGFSSEAIKYQYWENPVSTVKGLEEVNMMAAKFSHDVKGSAETFMKFDSQSMNPENLMVYECSSWNFERKKCMGSWKAMDQNDVSVDFPTTRVYLQNLDLYEIPEDITDGENKTILMNAYIVGTSSELGLRGDAPLTISSQQVAANKDISVSGTVVDGEGETVENADVEASFLKDGESFRSFTASSGPNGGFTVKGSAPPENGRYKVSVEVSKEKFQPFSTESRKTVEVFYETGLKMDSSENPSLKLGETSMLSYSLSNTGQRPVEDISISVEGLEDQYFSKASVPDTLEKGGTGSIEIAVDLPSDYCPAPCANPPIIDVKVTGTSGGEDVEASSTIYTSINRPQDQTDSEDEGQETEDAESEQPDESNPANQSSASLTEDIGNMTGNFLKRQSSVNIALGLIMIFTMILAVAIKKKKGDGNGRRREGRRAQGRARPVSGGESRVNKPQVSPDEEPDDADEAEEKPEENEEQEPSSSGLEQFYDEDKDSYVCDECEEGFDTAEGLEMHREINGLED